MTSLLPPDPLTRQAFKSWMTHAGFELERLDEKCYDIETDYYRNGCTRQAEIERDVELYGLKLEAECLRDCIKSVWRLYAELKDEMCE